MTIGELLDADWLRLLEFSRAPARPRRWRDAFPPRFACVVLLRTAKALHATGWIRLAKLTSLTNFVVFGIEVPPRLAIGPGLVIRHTKGMFLGAGHVGRYVTIYQQLTLGAKFADFDYDPTKRPRVEDGTPRAYRPDAWKTPASH